MFYIKTSESVWELQSKIWNWSEIGFNFDPNLIPPFNVITSVCGANFLRSLFVYYSELLNGFGENKWQGHEVVEELYVELFRLEKKCN